MNNLGLGVMLAMLGGNKESATVFSAAIGKKITALKLGGDDALHFTFDDGTRLKLYDDGQSCCESRYMRTDDDLSHFVGATLLGAEVKDGGAVEDSEYGGVHETQFLDVQTSVGVFQMVTHNEHNGYYGGFAVRAAAE